LKIVHKCRSTPDAFDARIRAIDAIPSEPPHRIEPDGVSPAVAQGPLTMPRCAYSPCAVPFGAQDEYRPRFAIFGALSRRVACKAHACAGRSADACSKACHNPHERMAAVRTRQPHVARGFEPDDNLIYCPSRRVPCGEHVVHAHDHAHTNADKTQSACPVLWDVCARRWIALRLYDAIQRETDIRLYVGGAHLDTRPLMPHTGDRSRECIIYSDFRG